MPYDGSSLAAGALSKAIGDIFSGMLSGQERGERLAHASLANTGTAAELPLKIGLQQAQLATAQRMYARQQEALQRLANGESFVSIAGEYPDIFPKTQAQLVKPFGGMKYTDYVRALRGPEATAAEIDAETARRRAVAEMDLARSMYYGRKAIEPLKPVVRNVYGVGLVDVPTGKVIMPEGQRQTAPTSAQLGNLRARASTNAGLMLDRLVSESGIGKQFDLLGNMSDRLESMQWLHDHLYRLELQKLGIQDPSLPSQKPMPPALQKIMLGNQGGGIGAWLKSWLFGDPQAPGQQQQPQQQQKPARPVRDPLGLFAPAEPPLPGPVREQERDEDEEAEEQ
jgi:hypothetical protein